MDCRARDVTIKNVDVDGGINNRETVAWYDADIVYIPKTRLRKRQEVA
jgi:hypothetical protein